ncbi:unnamed protein product [Hymenolepis diminuta]|uniref:HTH La-type RNA-binding domain-containing protein n=1 Tax=Hymenolepis diminuta TaxID=6216 RepID=A0A0R3S9N2_HYMDI|nr:unnamed protein product [Hymenolepis diminuta]
MGFHEQISNSMRNLCDSSNDNQTDNQPEENASAAGMRALTKNRVQNKPVEEVKSENRIQPVTFKHVERGTPNSNKAVDKKSEPDATHDSSNQQPQHFKKKAKRRFDTTVDLPLGKPKGKYVGSSRIEDSSTSTFPDNKTSSDSRTNQPPFQPPVQERTGEPQIIRNSSSFRTPHSRTFPARDQYDIENSERPNCQNSKCQVSQKAVVTDVDPQVVENSLRVNQVTLSFGFRVLRNVALIDPTTHIASSSSHLGGIKFLHTPTVYQPRPRSSITAGNQVMSSTSRSSSHPAIEEITIEALFEKMRTYSGSMRATRAFRDDKSVKKVLGSPEFSALSSRIETKHSESKERLIVIGEEIFLFVKKKPLRFSNRKSGTHFSHFRNFLFSDENLRRDTYLRELMSGNNGICPLLALLKFPRLILIEAEVEDLFRWGFTTNVVQVVAKKADNTVGFRALHMPSDNQFNIDVHSSNDQEIAQIGSDSQDNTRGLSQENSQVKQ